MSYYHYKVVDFLNINTGMVFKYGHHWFVKLNSHRMNNASWLDRSTVFVSIPVKCAVGIKVAK